jgi:uncharacterized protein
MFISLQELENKPVRFEVEVPPGRIDYDSRIKQSTALAASGTARLLNHSLGEIRLEGDARVEVEGTCDRCLEGAKFAIANHFDLVYVPASESALKGEDEVEEGGMDVGYYQGSGLELNDVLREVVLLALPMQFTCSESCRGICPVCGQNRNERDCGCAPESTDDRWSKLKSLREEITPRS